MGIGVEHSDRLAGAGAHEPVCGTAVLDPNHSVSMNVRTIEILDIEVALDEVVRTWLRIWALGEDDLREVAEQEPDGISRRGMKEHDHLGTIRGDPVPLLGVGRTRARCRCRLPAKGVRMDRGILFDAFGICRVSKQRDVLVHVGVPIRTMVDARIVVVVSSEPFNDMVLIVIARCVLPDEDAVPIVVVGDVVLERPYASILRWPLVCRRVRTRGSVHAHDHGVCDRKVLTTTNCDGR